MKRGQFFNTNSVPFPFIKRLIIRTDTDYNLLSNEFTAHLTSLGPSADPEAAKWFLRSAEQGNPKAQFRLGLLLYEGKLVPPDKIAAYKWITLAAESGDKEAKGLLREMELFLTQAQLVEARKHAAEFKPLRAGNPKS